VGVAALAVMAAALPGNALAKSKDWFLVVRPGQVTPGGSVKIKTTAGRKCGLTIRIGGKNYHYRLPKGGERFTFPTSTPLGNSRVSATCKGKVATINLKVVQGGQSTPPPTSPSTPPASSPAPPASPPPSAAGSSQTPITVANVCGLNPALGPIHDTTSAQGWPTAYWTDGTDSKVTLMAFSDDGDNKVDVAIVVTPDGQGIAYFAYCNWSSWLSVAQFEAQQAQQGVPSSQASSLGYLLQEQTDNAIFEEEQDWFQPAVGYQECPDNPYETCDYEPVDNPL
jgi:hypothetical protein